jgi:hypothetical protein
MVDLAKLREALAKPWPQHWEKNSIVAAASELLALKENGQTVWWICEKHNSKGAHFPGDAVPPVCEASINAAYRIGSNPFNNRGKNKCRMVKASLHIHREGT